MKRLICFTQYENRRYNTTFDDVTKTFIVECFDTNGWKAEAKHWNPFWAADSIKTLQKAFEAIRIHHLEETRTVLQ